MLHKEDHFGAGGISLCTISAADYLLPVLMGHFRGNAASLSRSLFFLTGASSEFFTNHLPIVEVKSKSHDVKSVRLSHTLLIAKRVRLVVGWTKRYVLIYVVEMPL